MSFQWSTVLKIAAASVLVHFAYNDISYGVKIEKRAPVSLPGNSNGLVCNQGQECVNNCKDGFSDCDGLVENGCETCADVCSDDSPYTGICGFSTSDAVTCLAGNCECLDEGWTKCSYPQASAAKGYFDYCIDPASDKECVATCPFGLTLNQEGLCEDIICDVGKELNEIGICIWKSDCALLNSWLSSIPADGCCEQPGFDVVCNDAGRVTRLIFDNMRNNPIGGKIPSSFGKLEFLQVLQIYRNNLSGQIPPSLGQLKSLQVLGLNENNLSGPIPSSLGQLKSLQYINLWSNNLSGEIPSSFGQLESLGFLNLESNSLSGLIPDFSNLSTLRCFLKNNLELCTPSGSTVCEINSELEVCPA